MAEPTRSSPHRRTPIPFRLGPHPAPRNRIHPGPVFPFCPPLDPEKKGGFCRHTPPQLPPRRSRSSPRPLSRGILSPLGKFPSHRNKPRRTSPYGYVHVAQQYLGLLEDLGLPKGKAELSPPPTLPKPHDAPSQPYLTILPGAAYGSAKRWDPNSFASVIRELQKSHSLQPILLGGPGDVEACRAVAQSLGSSITDLSGKTSTLELAHWLAHARLILCHDSGP
ncbi:MAG: hypothetical protein EBQ51_05275, partial [Verrucomicrobia bacterium]|nr:hypothetical protein [Verrucomicrobiota bacterium]